MQHTRKAGKIACKKTFKTLLSVICFKFFLTYHLFFNVPGSRPHVECRVRAGITLSTSLQQAEIRISLRITPFLFDNLKTSAFYNNTQRQSSLVLSLSIFVIVISLRKSSHLLNYMLKILLSLLVILCSIL